MSVGSACNSESRGLHQDAICHELTRDSEKKSESGRGTQYSSLSVGERRKICCQKNVRDVDVPTDKDLSVDGGEVARSDSAKGTQGEG